MKDIHDYLKIDEPYHLWIKDNRLKDQEHKAYNAELMDFLGLTGARPKAGDIYYSSEPQPDFFVITKATEKFAVFKPIGKIIGERYESAYWYTYNILPDLNGAIEPNKQFYLNRKFEGKRFKIKKDEEGYYFELWKKCEYLKQWKGRLVNCVWSNE